MANLKFKIGDRVRIVKNIWMPPNPGEDVGIGEVRTITNVYPNRKYPYELNGDWFYGWCDEELERVPNDKIVIRHDGKTTTATLFCDGVTKKKATANCAPEDKFDFATGAEIALKRLFNKEDAGMQKIETPKYYSGKVVCVESDYPYDFTVGKVYTFEDGVVKDNRGASRYVGHKIKDLSEIKKIWKFIPFVEDVEKPLTTEEIKAMDGQKVWLISLTNDKLPHIHDTLGGWHKVDAKNNKLLNEDESFFYIDANDTPFGFIAYRTAPSK